MLAALPAHLKSGTLKGNFRNPNPDFRIPIFAFFLRSSLFS